MDERAAIGRLQQGDIAGLEFLVRTHQREALRAANLITRDKALAEDVVQDAFLQAYERIGTFDACRPFGPWFRRCVVNLALKAAKRQGRHLELYGADARHDARLIDPDLGPDELLQLVEDSRSVRQAIDRLSPDQRAAVMLRYYGGLSDREAAEHLGRPAGTVKWWLHSARKQLRALLRPLRAETDRSTDARQRREDQS